jgi:hypothetical protein
VLRVREAHLRDHVAPLLNRNAVGAAKLDIVLRGVALANAREAFGSLPPAATWEELHDLVRPRDFYRSDTRLKRKWIGEQLLRLEGLRLLRRRSDTNSSPDRPQVMILRDDGSGHSIDEPTGRFPDSYVSISGQVISSGRLATWGCPQLAAYLAAMIAERYARSDELLAALWQLKERPLGNGRWYRPVEWFADKSKTRPPQHITVPFAARTLRRGLRLLREEGLITAERVQHDPRTGKRFEGRSRLVYTNHFERLNATSTQGEGAVMDIALERLRAQMSTKSPNEESE